MAFLEKFGLTIYVNGETARTVNGQIALLSLVNLARRTFLAGIEIVGPLDIQVVTNLATEATLADAVAALGGRVVEAASTSWPTALIGNVDPDRSVPPAWRLSWSGWRGGVIPASDPTCSCDPKAIPLAAALAAAVCVAEVFAFHAGDHAMAGKRSAGLSLWQPGEDWLQPDASEPAILYLPSRLWLIGLGNLGQAYAWLLACLPYADDADVELVLQDFDTLAPSNDSTSVLTSRGVIGRRKARWVSEWLERRGFRTFIEERRFGAWTHRHQNEPAVGLCGVDNAPTRAALEEAGFALVIESGLGAGVHGFRGFSLHTFPASRSAAEIWSSSAGRHLPADLAGQPAYVDLKAKGADQCGLAQLASRTVGAPFVGVMAGTLVIAELLRRLHGGRAFEVISLSALNLDDVEAISGDPHVYAHGYASAVSPSSG